MPQLLTGCEDNTCLPLLLAAGNCCLATGILLLRKAQILAPGAPVGGKSAHSRSTAYSRGSAPAGPRDEILLSAVVLWFTTVHVNRVRASLLCCRAGDVLGICLACKGLGVPQGLLQQKS